MTIASLRWRVASLPIWDWNHHNPEHWKSLFLRCEPTYMGLKHGYKRRMDWGKGCCEPTYMGLKHDIHLGVRSLALVASLPIWDWNQNQYWTIHDNAAGCEPTYMGLKLYPIISSGEIWDWNEYSFLAGSFIYLVASLPIWDWNHNLFSIRALSSSVASLPIWDWNYLTFLINLILFALRAYLYMEWNSFQGNASLLSN